MMFFQLILEETPSIPLPPGFFANGSWVGWLLAGFVLITLAGLGISKLLESMRQPEMYGLTREKIKDTWEEIESNADHGLMGAKLAVIEADKLLDNAMRSLVIPGETMGERLKAAQYRYPNIRKVWPAHKLRNQLVHDSAFEISVGQAKRALRDFHDALKTLHVL